LDNSLILQQFDKIEQRVERLVGTLRSLEGANTELKNRVSQLEEELQVKVGAEKEYSEEKAFVRSRIDGLLAKLGDVPGL
jgi:hypothetical protein